MFVVGFAVLVAHLAPGLYLRDSGELSTAAFTLGVAHETGFPLYCLLGKAAALLPLGEVAFRVGLLSALTGAAALAFLYRIVTVLGGGDATARVGGVVAAGVLLSGLTFFRSATVAEVYAPTACAIAAGLWLLERAAAGQRRAALGLALLGGLSLGLHAQLRLLLGPPVVVWALVRLRRGDRWPLLAPTAVVLGAAVVAYLPLRAARMPALDWADPRTLAQVIDHLQAARIRRAFAEEMFSRDPGTVLLHARAFAQKLEGQLGVPALLAAAAGLAWLLRERRTRLIGAVLAFMLAGDVVYSVWVNPMGLDDLQCGVPAAMVLAIAAGAAVQAGARRAGARAAPFAAAALGGLLCVPAALADLSGKRGLGPEAGAWTRAALAQAPPRALVLVTSDDLAAGALYAQVVAGARPDLTVLVRQQLWDGQMVAQRLARAGHEVRALDRWLKRSERERIQGEAELLRALVRGELPRRAVLWEPGLESPPAPVAAELPLFTLLASPRPLEPPRPQVETLEALLRPARDPFVRRLGASALSALGRVHLEQAGDLARSGALFEAALALRPEDGVAATNLAVVHARRGDFAGAQALVDEVLRREPGRLVARLNAARYRLARGDLDGAQAEFERARDRAPRSAAPLVGLARVAHTRGDHASARRLVAEALARDPHDPEARAAKEQLK